MVGKRWDEITLTVFVGPRQDWIGNAYTRVAFGRVTAASENDVRSALLRIANCSNDHSWTKSEVR